MVHNHVKSAKHQDGKKRLGTKEKCEQDITKALKASDKVTHPVGETLPQDQRLYRVKVVTAFLQAAIPLNKLESLQDLLEENGFHSSDRRHMSDIVPLIFFSRAGTDKRGVKWQGSIDDFLWHNSPWQGDGYCCPVYQL